MCYSHVIDPVYIEATLTDDKYAVQRPLELGYIRQKFLNCSYLWMLFFTEYHVEVLAYFAQTKLYVYVCCRMKGIFLHPLISVSMAISFALLLG